MAIRRPPLDTNGNVQMSNLPEPLPNLASVPTKATETWLRCFALGRMQHTSRVGIPRPRGVESNTTRVNLVAVALNKYLTDIGLGQYVPYIEDETTVLRCLIASPVNEAEPSSSWFHFTNSSS